MSDLFTESLQKLFPDGGVWEAKYREGDFKKLLQGLAIEFQRARDEGEKIPLDVFPDTTEMIDEWEFALGLPEAILTEALRRSRIDSRWKNFTKGSMQELFMEAVFYNSGIDVNVRVLNPGEDPRPYLVPSGVAVFNRVGSRYNATDVRMGNAFDSGIDAFLLVNGDVVQMVQSFLARYDVFQYNQLQYGEIGPPIRQPVDYFIPSNTDFWGMIYIIEDFNGMVKEIPAELEETFFDIAYQTKPLHMWAVARVKFV
jgi:hypothetical protein